VKRQSAGGPTPRRDRLHLALVGTRGVPARYGGFETAVEEIGQRLVASGHRVTVYCRGSGASDTYLGMELVHLPAVRRKALETLSHTAASALHAVTHPPDVAFVFNAGNAPFVPVLQRRGIPVALHLDGLEWKRDKWRGAGARYYRWAESFGVRYADALIADARGIADYLREQYDTGSTFIPYGAPSVQADPGRVAEVGLVPGEYHLVVARLEPENNVHVIAEGHHRSEARLPLAIVGAAPYGDTYVSRLQALTDSSEKIKMLGSVWDQQLLDALYAGCTTYWHGHSVGGTNPSLLRAIGAGAPVAAFDVVFNREVTNGHALFFDDAADVASLAAAVEDDGQALHARAQQALAHVRTAYQWDEVAARYEDLARELVAGGRAKRTP
jgi:glycosyltransferase involved in cell wall biosynthesis